MALGSDTKTDGHTHIYTYTYHLSINKTKIKFKSSWFENHMSPWIVFDTNNDKMVMSMCIHMYSHQVKYLTKQEYQ